MSPWPALLVALILAIVAIWLFLRGERQQQEDWRIARDRA